MENAIGIQSTFNKRNEGRLVHGSDSVRGKTANRRSTLLWFRILRVHYHWPLFQAIRFALWLAR
jgi:hypothetical protein